MNADELKKIQAPLKEQYRAQPDSAVITLKAVATALGIEVNDGTIKAEGDLDFKGTLGVSKEVPVGFRAIRLYFHLDADITEEQMASLKKLTERYCVVYQTLTNGVGVETNYQHG
jgi:uncharacterized OsmC-like protein